MRHALAGLLAAAALAGCGGDGGADAPAGRVDDDRAAAAAGETKVGLDRALEKYREGDRSATAERLQQTRSEHFDLVEPALRDDDATLASRLHRALYEELPRMIDDGVTVSELAERLADVAVDLDDAVAKLRAP